MQRRLATLEQMGLSPEDLFNVVIQDASPGGNTEQFLNVSVADGPYYGF